MILIIIIIIFFVDSLLRGAIFLVSLIKRTEPRAVLGVSKGLTEGVPGHALVLLRWRCGPLQMGPLYRVTHQ